MLLLADCYSSACLQNAACFNPERLPGNSGRLSQFGSLYLGFQVSSAILVYDASVPAYLTELKVTKPPKTRQDQVRLVFHPETK